MGRPLVLITGAAGNLGRTLAAALKDRYDVVGLDVTAGEADYPIVQVDLTDPANVQKALAQVAEDHGRQIASVLHLAAFFDFSGEDRPQYRTVNVEGSRNLMRALRKLEVEQFVYSGTMLVHAAGRAAS